MDDLWPRDLVDDFERTSTPLSVLKEQASFLGPKFGNLIEGKVEPASWTNEGRYPFQYSFSLFAPTLENYTFIMFYVCYDIELYPIQILLDEDILAEIEIQEFSRICGNRMLEIDSQDNFLKGLRMIFGSKRLKKLIGALLSQVG
ncbi:MAG: hypothetical protein ACLQPD_08860 [Desulfomonilaceae bacterium]